MKTRISPYVFRWIWSQLDSIQSQPCAEEGILDYDPFLLSDVKRLVKDVGLDIFIQYHDVKYNNLVRDSFYYYLFVNHDLDFSQLRDCVYELDFEDEENPKAFMKLVFETVYPNLCLDHLFAEEPIVIGDVKVIPAE